MIEGADKLGIQCRYNEKGIGIQYYSLNGEDLIKATYDRCTGAWDAEIDSRIPQDPSNLDGSNHSLHALLLLFYSEKASRLKDRRLVDVSSCDKKLIDNKSLCKPRSEIHMPMDLEQTLDLAS